MPAAVAELWASSIRGTCPLLHPVQGEAMGALGGQGAEQVPHESGQRRVDLHCRAISQPERCLAQIATGDVVARRRGRVPLPGRGSCTACTSWRRTRLRLLRALGRWQLQAWNTRLLRAWDRRRDGLLTGWGKRLDQLRQ